MHKLVQNGLGTIWLMCVLLCLQACGMPAKRKAKSKLGASNAVTAADESLASEAFSFANSGYVWPACAGPYNAAPPRFSQGSGMWRNEVSEATSRVLLEIQQNGLTQESAVQLALVNNPDLFAYYENLEVGYAGLLEAGLRENPVLKDTLRYPDQPGKHLNHEFEMTTSFLDYFLITFRERAAEADIQVIADLQMAREGLNVPWDFLARRPVER